MQYVPNLNIVISLSLIFYISKALKWQLPSGQSLQLRAMSKKNNGWLCAYSIEVSIVMSTKFTSNMRVSEVISNGYHTYTFTSNRVWTSMSQPTLRWQWSNLGCLYPNKTAHFWLRIFMIMPHPKYSFLALYIWFFQVTISGML